MENRGHKNKPSYIWAIVFGKDVMTRNWENDNLLKNRIPTWKITKLGSYFVLYTKISPK
jgi:hypothetical protein